MNEENKKQLEILKSKKRKEGYHNLTKEERKIFATLRTIEKKENFPIRLKEERQRILLSETLRRDKPIKSQEERNIFQEIMGWVIIILIGLAIYFSAFHEWPEDAISPSTRSSPHRRYQDDQDRLDNYYNEYEPDPSDAYRPYE